GPANSAPTSPPFIGRITTAGVVTEYPITATRTGVSFPDAITAGPDGALWFTDINAAAIGRVTTAGVITDDPIPASPHDPYADIGGTRAGRDGALWFTDRNFTDSNGAIGRFDPNAPDNLFTHDGLQGALSGQPPVDPATGNPTVTLQAGTQSQA